MHDHEGAKNEEKEQDAVLLKKQHLLASCCN
jgi:hypothetical protein